MNPFILSFFALCLTQGALAQYSSGGSGYGQQSGGGGAYQQRKMAPSPQTYGAQQSSHGGAMSSYGQGEQQNNYESGYGKSGNSAATSYNRPTASYGAATTTNNYQQQQTGYAKAAPKYEEPSYPPMPFAWGYDINDGYGGAQYHKESGDEYGKRTGSYGYTDAYGIYRQVDYVADEHGFRATIKTNEPGTANESPADVELHAYEPPSNYYAGNTQSYGSQQQSYSSQQQSYGGQQQQSYGSGKQNAGYGQAAASYGSAQKSYAAPAMQSSYNSGSRSSYGAKSTGGYATPRASQQSYGAGESYAAGSQVVPTYSKASVAVAPAKKY